MKLFVAILAILAVAYSQDAPLCNNYVEADSEFSYTLSSLRKDVGYYTYTDPNTGKIYMWNTCGSLDDYCGANAAACISESGDLSVPDFTRAGSIDSYSYNIYADEEDERIEVTFYNGDWCDAYQTNRSITFVYHCDESYTEAQVLSIDTSDDCENVVLDIYTSAACGSGYAGGSDDIFNHYSRVYFRALMIFIWCSVGLFALLCCCACCALIRRRRCQRSGKCGYNAVSQHVELTQQVVQVPAKPTAPVVNQSTQTVPQYPYFVPAPQYYYYMPQTQQAPVQQPPVVPLEQVHDSQMEADEKLARELQAKFNQEV